MIESVSLGGKWWAHSGVCSEVQIGPHIHYGQHVIVPVDPKMVPTDVLAEYDLLFGSGAMLETTDAPGYSTTAVIPTKRTDHDHQH